MPDKFQEIRDEIDELESKHQRFTRENPELEKLNASLKDDIKSHNQKVVEAMELVDKAKEEAGVLKTKADKYIAEAKIEVENLRSEQKIEADKLSRELDSRSKALDEREAVLNQIDLKQAEKASQLKKESEALDETAKTLSTQAKEIEDAAKVLNTKATDLTHEASHLKERSLELDSREKKIVSAEIDAGEQLKEAQLGKKRVQELLNNAHDVAIRNDSKTTELDKRAVFLSNKEKQLKQKEAALNDRAGVMASN